MWLIWVLTKKKLKKKYAEIIKKQEIKNIPVDEKKEIKLKETGKKEIKIGNKIDEITGIANRRGFFFQTANIYGGKLDFLLMDIWGNY